MKTRVYVTRLDLASHPITKVHRTASDRDRWLEAALWNAYKAHCPTISDPDWPAILPADCNRIQFMLSKLDWYEVEYNVCEVEG